MMDNNAIQQQQQQQQHQQQLEVQRQVETALNIIESSSTASSIQLIKEADQFLSNITSSSSCNCNVWDILSYLLNNESTQNISTYLFIGNTLYNQLKFNYIHFNDVNQRYAIIHFISQSVQKNPFFSTLNHYGQSIGFVLSICLINNHNNNYQNEQQFIWTEIYNLLQQQQQQHGNINNSHLIKYCIIYSSIIKEFQFTKQLFTDKHQIIDQFIQSHSNSLLQPIYLLFEKDQLNDEKLLTCCIQLLSSLQQYLNYEFVLSHLLKQSVFLFNVSVNQIISEFLMDLINAELLSNELILSLCKQLLTYYHHNLNEQHMKHSISEIILSINENYIESYIHDNVIMNSSNHNLHYYIIQFLNLGIVIDHTNNDDCNSFFATIDSWILYISYIYFNQLHHHININHIHSLVSNLIHQISKSSLLIQCILVSFFHVNRDRHHDHLDDYINEVDKLKDLFLLICNVLGITEFLKLTTSPLFNLRNNNNNNHNNNNDFSSNSVSNSNSYANSTVLICLFAINITSDIENDDDDNNENISQNIHVNNNNSNSLPHSKNVGHENINMLISVIQTIINLLESTLTSSATTTTNISTNDDDDDDENKFISTSEIRKLSYVCLTSHIDTITKYMTEDDNARVIRMIVFELKNNNLNHKSVVHGYVCELLKQIIERLSSTPQKINLLHELLPILSSHKKQVNEKFVWCISYLIGYIENFNKRYELFIKYAIYPFYEDLKLSHNANVYSNISIISSSFHAVNSSWIRLKCFHSIINIIHEMSFNFIHDEQISKCIGKLLIRSILPSLYDDDDDDEHHVTNQTKNRKPLDSKSDSDLHMFSREYEQQLANISRRSTTGSAIVMSDHNGTNGQETKEEDKRIELMLSNINLSVRCFEKSGPRGEITWLRTSSDLINQLIRTDRMTNEEQDDEKRKNIIMTIEHSTSKLLEMINQFCDGDINTQPNMIILYLDMILNITKQQVKAPVISKDIWKICFDLLSFTNNESIIRSCLNLFKFNIHVLEVLPSDIIIKQFLSICSAQYQLNNEKIISYVSDIVFSLCIHHQQHQHFISLLSSLFNLNDFPKLGLNSNIKQMMFSNIVNAIYSKSKFQLKKSLSFLQQCCVTAGYS